MSKCSLRPFFPPSVGVQDKQPVPSKSRFLSNPLGAHAALICHSEKVPWSVKWPVDDLCGGAAAGTRCPLGQGAEESKSASRPSVSICTALACQFATSKPLNAPLKNQAVPIFMFSSSSAKEIVAELQVLKTKNVLFGASSKKKPNTILLL